MEADTAKTLINSVVDNNRIDEWITTSTPVSFLWHGANRFRVKDENGMEYAYGSATVVGCLVRGSITTAAIQTAKLEIAAEMRKHNRYV